MAKDKGKGRTIKADFSNVDLDSRGSAHVKPGDYRARVKKTEMGQSQAGNTKVVVTYELLDKGVKGKEIKEHFALTEKALFKLGRFLRDGLGKKVPKKSVSLNIDSWVGEELVITLEDNEYEGNDGKTRLSSSVADYMQEMPDEDIDEDEDEDEDEEDEKPKKKGKKGKKSKKDDDDDEEDLEEVDLDDEL